MEVVNAYQSGRGIILLRRDEVGKLHTTTASPEYVVYLRPEDIGAELSRKLSQKTYVRSFQKEGPWLRVGFSDGLIRDEVIFGRRGSDSEKTCLTARQIPTFEGDVSPVRRLLTDRGATIQRPRRTFFDLETDSRVPFSRKEDMRILSWAIVAPDGRKWSDVLKEDGDGAERDLLGRFWEVMEEFDQFLAWNGDNFDFPVLKARVDRSTLRLDYDRWLYLDHLALFKRMNMHSAESGDEKQSMKLNSIAQALLGEGKHDFDASKTYEKWAAGGKDREELLAYNEQDTDLLRKIEDKTGFAALFDTLADACRIFPESGGLHPTKQMDGFMLRIGLDRGVHFPTKRYREVTEQFEGAFVMEPKAKGIARDVHVCDFASLYPSIILTLNMSPETKQDIPINGPIPDGFCRAPVTRQGFRGDVDGILCFALRELLRLRKFWNEKKVGLPPGTPEWYEADRRSTAYKVAANSFYGVVGSPFSRFFDKRIAESVTSTGQWLIKRTIEEAERLGMYVIYGDTDSVFVTNATRTQFEEFVRWCNAELYPKIIAELGCKENHIKLAYEKQFVRIVFTGAKRYAGMYAHYKGKASTKDSKPEIKGLEFKRGDTALLARQLQEKIIDRMIVGADERIDTFRCLIDETLQRVLNDTLPIEEVSISKAVTKKLKEYVPKKKKDNTDAEVPVHVRVAKVLEARGQEVGEGTRISYVVTDGDGGINVAIPADDYRGDFDRYYLWEKLVYPPAQRVLQCAFPDVDWVAGYERVRPPRPRLRRGRADPNQLGLQRVPHGASEIVVTINEHFNGHALSKLAALVKCHPGSRPLTIHIRLDTGAVAVLGVPQRVSGSPGMMVDLEALFWDCAAYRELEEACVS